MNGSIASLGGACAFLSLSALALSGCRTGIRSSEFSSGNTISASDAGLSERDDWRQKPPTPGPSRAIPFPDFRRTTLRNSIPVYFYKNDAVPLAVIRILAKSGSCTDPKGKEGLANFVGTLLRHRSPAGTGADIVAEIEEGGGTLISGASYDFSFVTMETLSADLPSALRRLSQIVQRPKFERSEIEQRRKQTLVEIQRQADNGALMAQRALRASVYGRNHPCSHGAVGSKDGIERVSRQDVLGFYQSHWTARNLAIVAVGDISEETLRELDRNFGSRNDKTRVVTDNPIVPAAWVSRQLVIVDRPGAAQADFALGHIGPPITSEKWPSVILMGHALGGFYLSRMTETLRRQKGYVYNTSSLDFVANGQQSLLSLRNTSAIENSAPSVLAVLNEIQRMIDDPPHDKELELAKTNASDGVLGLLQTNQQIAAVLTEMAVANLPPDHLRSYLIALKQVTPAQMADAAREFLSPKELSIVVAGPADKLRDGLVSIGSFEEWTAQLSARSDSTAHP